MSNTRQANKSIAGCVISIFWGGAMAFGFPGVMGTYWQEKFAVGPAEVGTVVTFMLLALAVAMFFSGKVHMAIGIRKCIIIGWALTVGAFGILLLATNIYMVYVWAFVTNLGCSFIYGPGLTTGQQWMPQQRGLVSGIINLSFGIAAAIMSPIWNLILENYGEVALVIFIVVCITVSDFVAAAITTDPHRAKGGAAISDKDLTVGQALRTKDFWIIWFMWAFAGAAGISMVSLAKSYAIVLGIAGVTILTVFNMFNGLVRIVVGYLADKIGGELTGIIAFVLSGLGYFLLPHTTNLVAICLCAGFVGIGFGTLFTVSGPIISKRFGLKYFGLIFGIVFTAYGLIGGIAGPAVAGVVLAITGGDYVPVFTYLGVFSFIGAFLMCWLLRNRTKA